MKPVVLVTGVSSGIGLALTRKLWNTDYRVIATARKESLGKIGGESFQENDRFLLRALDVQSFSERTVLIREIEERWGGVDILVNNAGVSFRSVIEHMSEQEEREQFEINFSGPMALTRLVLPSMRQKRSGKIINVSSVGGMMAMPTMGYYSASKFALEGATEALWYEMRPWNIKVSLVQPGFVHSNSFRNVRWSRAAKASAQGKEAYTEYYSGMGSFIERCMNLARSTPESIAQVILQTIQAPNPALRVPATIDAHLFSLVRRFLPRRLYHWILLRNLPDFKQWGPHEDH